MHANNCDIAQSLQTGLHIASVVWLNPHLQVNWIR